MSVVVGWVTWQLLYTAHVGDSRAILVRDGEAACLTEDHKPSKPEECKRIEKSGGKVLPGSDRVMGRSPSERLHVLAMSRYSTEKSPDSSYHMLQGSLHSSPPIEECPSVESPYFFNSEVLPRS